MNIKEFEEMTKGNSKLVNECADDYLKNIVDEIASEYNVNKSIAKFILMKSINYNCVKESINEQIEFMDNESIIYEQK